MELKTTDLGQVITMERHVAIPDVAPESMRCCETIYRAIEALGLTVEGPWHFISYGLPQDEHTRFRVKFCLPVSGATEGVPGEEPRIESLDPFYCASRTFTGHLHQLFELGYHPLMADINASKRHCTGESREVYHRWAGPQSADNLIEIQFGITPA